MDYSELKQTSLTTLYTNMFDKTLTMVERYKAYSALCMRSDNPDVICIGSLRLIFELHLQRNMLIGKAA